MYTQNGHTPLLLACEKGLSDVAQLLINKGASFDVIDEVSYYFYINNLNSASHFVIYLTVRRCVNINIFLTFYTHRMDALLYLGLVKEVLVM